MNFHAPITCAPVTRKFISAVRRRIILVRIAESIAIATAVASGAGLALVPILWWDGQPALPLAAAMLLLGAVSGIIWGISRRPTLFQAAAEADRQLNLHDLLGTVHLLSQKSDQHDPWTSAIAAMSDTQIRSLRPSDVIVNRLGLRAWSSVGILGALLIALSLFTARPINVSAAPSTSELNPATDLRQTIQNPTALANQSTQSAARPPGPGGTDDISNRGAELPPRPDSSPDSKAQPNLANSQSSAAANSSTGAGSAITHLSQPPQDIDSPAIAKVGKPQGQSGQTGSGQSDPNANTPGDSAATTATEAANHQSPPWTSNQWPTDAAAAQSAIVSGRVPDSDADLVRDYFRRD